MRSIDVPDTGLIKMYKDGLIIQKKFHMYSVKKQFKYFQKSMNWICYLEHIKQKKMDVNFKQTIISNIIFSSQQQQQQYQCILNLIYLNHCLQSK
ncbi:unnamed protein product [Paramecium sonneborni]|uniref:Uncharacterized protein n=1 Tax=Paramecium sonneborni TaxID=65129 RepID=A0A8S1RR44_9CILI|nr:unnamed protein product [Paramecium sonneborni]